MPTEQESKDADRRFIPIEVVTNILLRLPVKVLGRFKSVSYEWYLLINSQHFIKLHLQRANSIEQIPNNLQLIYHVSPIFIHTLDFGELVKGKYTLIDEYGDPDPSILRQLFTINGCNVPIGSCNGIVCFRNKEGCRFLLMNPTTGTHIDLPFLYDSRGHYESMDSTVIAWYGFGYDTVGDDYKVVKITQLDKHQRYSEIMVYSWRKKAWKRYDKSKCKSSFCLVSDEYIYPSCNATLFDNALHWFVCTTSNAPTTFFAFDQIACFDLNKEEFRHPIPLPKTDLRYCTMAAHCNGAALLLHTTANSNYEVHNRQDLWIMKEYGASWCELDSNVNGFRPSKPIVHLSKNYRYNWLYDCITPWDCYYNNNKHLVRHDLCRDSSEYIFLPVSRYLVDQGEYVSHTYVESLVTLNIDDDRNLKKRKTSVVETSDNLSRQGV